MMMLGRSLRYVYVYELLMKKKAKKGKDKKALQEKPEGNAAVCFGLQVPARRSVS